MRVGRREFLKAGLLAASATVLGAQTPAPPDIELEAPLSPPPLDVSALARFVDRLPIPPQARPIESGGRDGKEAASAPARYRIEMREFFGRVHRDLPAARMWGYEGGSPGPTFEVRKDRPIEIEWVNRLPRAHLFAVDTSIHGAEADKPRVRTVVHVHGARVSADNDGYPEKWFASGGSALYDYPNRQDAAMLWYHDHALGITRLNIFAGLFGAYFIRDEVEDALGLPCGRYEIPLLVCDRAFDRRGQLDYPIGPLFGHPWVPEFSGNAVVLNGKLFPFIEVEPALYRLRVVNVSNGRTFTISLSSGLSFFQIGSDQGLLAAPVEARAVEIAPAERADLIFDFRRNGGRTVALQNEGTEIMQFRISTGATPLQRPLPSRLRDVERIAPSRAVRTRILTLDEYFDSRGRVVRSLLNRTRWSAPVTERPRLGTTEIWALVNLTRDAHPVHLHGVRFQVLDRRAIDVAAFQKNRSLVYTGTAKEPSAGESGWKDTVRADPGAVTRIIVPFESFAGLYSWHCHILEHEDHEMMRPFEIVAADQTGNR